MSTIATPEPGWLEDASVITRYARMSPDDFDRDTTEKWAVAQQIRDVVRNAVKGQQILPLDGARILSCATAGLFGYDAFHNQETSSPELVAALSGRLNDRSQDRELAGVR